MALFGLGGSDDKAFPLELKADLHPFRISRADKHGSDVDVAVRNRSGKAVLSSLVVQLPDGLGFDGSGLNMQKEIRLGEFAPGEARSFSFPIYANGKAREGEYKVRIRAMVHYRGYQLVEREYGVALILRVV